MQSFQNLVLRNALRHVPPVLEALCGEEFPIRSTEANTGNGAFREKVYSAARVFLDNVGSLALKKLFEGQLQALRIDVLEELEDDNDVRTRVPVKLRKNGFMYLKWLFTRETV